jgi:hypothetical protein
MSAIVWGAWLITVGNIGLEQGWSGAEFGRFSNSIGYAHPNYGNR